MVRAADAQPVLLAERDRARPPAAGRARRQHEPVAEHPPDGMARVARDRRGDEAVGRAREQRDLGAGGGAQRVGVVAVPVAVDQRSVAQVADPRAAAAQEARERPRLGQCVQGVRREVGPLRERGAAVRRAEADDVADAAGPVHPRLDRLVAGAARDEAAHRVADERDLGHLGGPRGDDLLEQLGQRAPVLRDVAAAVVADVERGAAEVALEPRAVGLATAEPPRELRLHQPVQEHDEPRSRPGVRGGERSALRRHARPPTRSAIGCARSDPEASSASP